MNAGTFFLSLLAVVLALAVVPPVLDAAEGPTDEERLAEAHQVGVRVDQARHDGPLVHVQRGPVGVGRGQGRLGPDRDEPAVLDRERLGRRLVGVDGVDGRVRGDVARGLGGRGKRVTSPELRRERRRLKKRQQEPHRHGVIAGIPSDVSDRLLGTGPGYRRCMAE